MSEIKTLTINGQTFTVADPDAAHIDDTAVGEKAWSSRRIMEAVEEVDRSAAIICDARGQAVTLPDASHRPLKALTLYGKTTQNSTPTPEAPVPLESAGAGGSIGVTVTGKNLLYYPYRQKSRTHNGVTFTDNGDGSITVNGTATGGTATHDLYLSYDSKLMLEVGKQYTLSGCPAGGNGNYYLNFQNTTYVQSVTDKGDGITFTAEYDRWYGWIAVKEGVTVNNLTFYPMLRIADTSAEYAPYQKQTLAVATPNGLNGIGDVKDSIDFARGVMVQKLSAMRCDGSEEWQAGSNNQFYILKQNMPKPHKGNSKGILSSHFAQNSAAPRCYLGGAWGFTVQITGIATLEEWKAWLSNNPVDVVYELETPIETPLTAEELGAYAALHTNKPNTTVMCDAGAEMALSYVADTKAYIDNKLASLT